MQERNFDAVFYEIDLSSCRPAKNEDKVIEVRVGGFIDRIFPHFSV